MPADPGPIQRCRLHEAARVSCLPSPLHMTRPMTPAAMPAPATTKPIVETVASELAESMSLCCDGGHRLPLQLFFTLLVLERLITPVMPPRRRPAPATTAPPMKRGLPIPEGSGGGGGGGGGATTGPAT